MTGRESMSHSLKEIKMKKRGFRKAVNDFFLDKQKAHEDIIFYFRC